MYCRYKCFYYPVPVKEKWDIEIQQLMPFEPMDFEVNARGSTFHIIMGEHSRGRYLCIPNWGIALDMGDADDCFWNYEHLKMNYPNLSMVDATSISNALSIIKHYND